MMLGTGAGTDEDSDNSEDVRGAADDEDEGGWRSRFSSGSFMIWTSLSTSAIIRFFSLSL